MSNTLSAYKSHFLKLCSRIKFNTFWNEATGTLENFYQKLDPTSEHK